MKVLKGKELRSEEDRRAIRDFGRLVSDLVYDEAGEAFLKNISPLPVAVAAEKAVTRALTAQLATDVPKPTQPPVRPTA